MDTWVVPLFDHGEQCCCEDSVQQFWVDVRFISLGYVLRAELLGHLVTVFNCRRSCGTGFQSSRTLVHAHQQGLAYPFAPLLQDGEGQSQTCSSWCPLASSPVVLFRWEERRWSGCKCRCGGFGE